MWEAGSGISLSSCSCSQISLNSSFSFGSLFLILSLSFSSGRLLFFPISFSHLSTFPAFLTCSHFFLYPASLPLSRQSLKSNSNKLENEFMLFLDFLCLLGTLARICHLFVSQFLGLTLSLTMAFH